VIDRRYPLSEIAEAHCYVEAGHKRGHVLVLIERDTLEVRRGSSASTCAGAWITPGCPETSLRGRALFGTR
jgi:hypothetical protein